MEATMAHPLSRGRFTLPDVSWAARNAPMRALWERQCCTGLCACTPPLLTEIAAPYCPDPGQRFLACDPPFTKCQNNCTATYSADHIMLAACNATCAWGRCGGLMAFVAPCCAWGSECVQRGGSGALAQDTTPAQLHPLPFTQTGTCMKTGCDGYTGASPQPWTLYAAGCEWGCAPHAQVLVAEAAGW